ncbi:MAG: DUF1150 family protein [Alphaproteobacteria bacterium]|nr:DUF1150 family protein [Alphaproteobacteria bacterium]
MNAKSRTESSEKLRRLSSGELASLGINDIAYVKRVMAQGGIGYAIHAADGTPVAVMPDQAHAIAVVLEHDLHPVSVH